jgi:succinoglycan biosynthesis transport protein ExoP
MASQYKLKAASQPQDLESSEPLRLNGTRLSYGPLFDEQSAVLHYWQILRKRRWYVLGTLVVIFGISVAVSLMSTRIYEASSKLAIFPEDASAVGFKDSANENTTYDNDLALQTQASILLSDTLALKAIDTMHLDRDPRFTGSSLKGPIQPAGPAHDNAQTMALLRRFRGGLKVEPVPGTRIVLVNYSDPDPRLAADIVNTLVQTFIEANVRTRYESATQTAEWLSKELSDLRVRVEASEEKLVRYQRQNGILGIDEKQNIVTAKLDELNKELIAAESDRIQKESNYSFAMSVDPAASDKTYQPAESPLLDKLMEKEADLNTQYAQLTTQFGSGYPKVAELSNQLKQLRTEIAGEQSRIGRSLRSEYLAAVQREKMLTTAMEEQKQRANKLNESAIEYSVLKRDADSNHQLYDSLLQKLKEAGIAAGLRSSNIRVVDVAQVPDLPVSPHVLRNLAFGLLLGLGGGIALALVFDNLDTTVRNIEEAKAICTLPALGMIPRQGFPANGHLKRGYLRKVLGAVPKLNGNTLSLIAHAQPNSPAAESFRALRTSIILSSFGTAPRVILVTSSLPQEGKSTITANSAIVMAQRGSRVLLVDGDLREPAIAKMFGVTDKGGLSTVIEGRHRFEDVVVPILHVPNLSILCSGAPSSQPAEVLGSNKMKECISRWRDEFDYVIIDSPPCLSFTDAVLLSREADGVILVARWGQTTKAALRAASDLLLQVNAKMIGLVLNAFDLNAIPYDRAFRPEYYKKMA